MSEEREHDGRRITAVEVRWIAAGLLAVLFGIFVAQNTVKVTVHFVFVDVSVRLIWVFLVCALLGGVIDRLLVRRGVLPPGGPRRRRDR